MSHIKRRPRYILLLIHMRMGTNNILLPFNTLQITHFYHNSWNERQHNLINNISITLVGTFLSCCWDSDLRTTYVTNCQLTFINMKGLKIIYTLQCLYAVTILISFQYLEKLWLFSLYQKIYLVEETHYQYLHTQKISSRNAIWNPL